MKIIDVTQEDIDSGVQGSSYNCAIARALMRLGIGTAICVGGDSAFRVDKDKYMLPKKGQMFVKKFDRNKKSVKPFSFALRKVRETELVNR